MITLITGLPGNGKTLFALWLIEAYIASENAALAKIGKPPREVFYSGIKELLFPWTEIKPEEWQSCPPGAIIVTDEAQFVYPKKPNGSKLPDFYDKLAVHRHSGYDMFFITQDPALVDVFVRKLCGRHFHCIRKFGMQRCNVWEWSVVNTSPEKASSHKTAVLQKFKYPKRLYGMYKSAEVHTVKRSIPIKLILAALFVVSVVAVGYYALDHFQKRASGKVDGSAPGVSASAASGGSGPSAKPNYQNALADARQFVFERSPRIVGLDYTAPRYDEITRPTTAPVPVACVVNKSKGCTCYSQQGTRMAVDRATCGQIVERGYFQDFDSEPRYARSDRSDAPVQQLASSSSQSPVPPSSQVVTLPGDGYGVLARRDVVKP